MKMIHRSIAVLATAAALAAFVPLSAAEAAGYSYGSIVISPDASEALLTYKTLDEQQTWVCDLGGEIECDAGAEFAPEPGVSIPGVMFTPDMSKAVLRTGGILALLDLKANTVAALVQRDSGDRYFSLPRLSPDGRFLAYYNPATQSNPVRHFRLVDFQTKNKYVLSETVNYWDLLSEESVLFQFSPDSRSLVYKDDRGGHPTLYRVDLAALTGSTFQGTPLFTRAYSVSDFLFADTDTLLYLANRETPMRFDLYSYGLGSGSLQKIAENASYHPPMRRAGDLVFFNRLVSWGSEVVAYDLSKEEIKTLPQPKGSFEDLEAGKDTVFPGGVHGALILPDDFRSSDDHQLVVWLHGGPYRQAALGYHPYPSYGVYDWVLEGLREKGAIVLKLDYHGSYAHGRPFAESIKGNVGVKDVQDVLAAVAELEDRYDISETYLMGVSYGGYLALRSLVESPRTFEGAISINGVTDWLGLVNSNPNTIFAADFDGPLRVDNTAFYDRASILAKVPSLTDQKVVLMHSDRDTSVSFSQSSILASILQTAGKNVEFTPLADEDHVLARQESAMQVCEITFDALGLRPGESCEL